MVIPISSRCGNVQCEPKTARRKRSPPPRQPDLTHPVQNKWLCGQFLRELALPVATTEMARFVDPPVLVVERFDRAWSTRADGQPWIARLPQGDFCQVMGLPSHAKYEATGGPRMQ
jgi:serine/threonine-protein kinase HipA